MLFTEEQIKKLEKYRKTFETAVKSDFARNVGSIALKDIEAVYDEAIGTHYSYNSGCSVCVLGFIKKVGKSFLEDSEAYKRKAEKKLKEQQEQGTNTNLNPAPKTNKRKKKVEQNGPES